MSSANAIASTAAARYPAGLGWARTQINAVIYREQALFSTAGRQFMSYYDQNQQIVIAHRDRSSSRFQLHQTDWESDARDAHKTICMGASPDGTLHLVAGLHNQPLDYRRSKTPLDPTSFGDPEPMLGAHETSVTYPTFCVDPKGALYFFWREGTSGRGNIHVNVYDTETAAWRGIQHPLISGEKTHSPYHWRPAFGADGSLHIVWCWRRSSDASTNSLMCYAVSRDGGETWQDSTGAALETPITMDRCEVADPVPENENLVNQGPLIVDPRGNPHAIYCRNDPDNRFGLVHLWHTGAEWRTRLIDGVGDRYDVSGKGSLAMPLGRPNLVADREGAVYVVFRESRDGGRVRVARSLAPSYDTWDHRTLLTDRLDQWEPCIDTPLWQQRQILGLLVQRVGQESHEQPVSIPPQAVSVVEVGLCDWWTAEQAVAAPMETES